MGVRVWFLCLFVCFILLAPFVGWRSESADSFVEEPLHGEAIQRLLLLLIGRAESSVLAVGRYHHAHTLQTAPAINHRCMHRLDRFE
jgi:hypothetical protein